jgi:hypothetical protein
LAVEPSPAAVEFFEKEVRPLLTKQCVSCHSETKAKGGLKLTSRAALLTGGGSGPAVVPGKPDASLLVQAVRYKDSPRMPPKQRLSDSEIDVLARWVQLGAPWPDGGGTTATKFRISDEQRRHWAFQPVKDPPLPSVKDAAWAQTPIDRFILARLAAKELKPAAEAERRTLVRRATFDLIGLPPTLEEMEAALGDKSDQWFARVVDRLLASPHYGERWGRHWLDLVRYADTAGETADFPVPDAWRYRNYVIAAFNADKPYDQFIKEQLAGDILAASGPRDRYAEQVVATGYLAIARRFGFEAPKHQHLTIDDTLDVLGKSLLGLTLSCARCHDHKFDPIASADYYALYGILDSTRYPHPGSEGAMQPLGFAPLLPPTEAEARRKVQQAELAPFEAAIRRAEGDIAAAERAIKQLRSVRPVAPALGQDPAEAQDADKRVAELQARLPALNAAAGAARKRRDEAAIKFTLEQAYAVADGKGHNVRIHKRGEPTDLGDEAPRRFLEILGGQELPTSTQGSGRLQLAEWIASKDNPLTARVLVNRVWQHHFGQGLVRSASNFGTRGRPPTHPELLDYLATRFVESGWSIKALHRHIMLSRTYRLASIADSPSIDADNELLAHFPRRRLDAEAIRDSLLAVGGNLDRTPGERHPFPSRLSFTQHGPFQAVYETDRRSVYLMTQRIRRHPFLALFDGADTNASTEQRSETTVPTQALYFLNNPFIHQQSEKLAQRLLAAAATDRARVELAQQLAFGRPATEQECRAAQDYLQRYAQQLETARVPAEKRSTLAWASYARVLFGSNEFIYVD